MEILKRMVMVVLGSAMLAGGFNVAAQSRPAPVPVEDFVRRPNLSSIKFSPNGRWMAALEQYKGRMNITTMDTETGALRHVTAFEGFDVAGSFRWVSDSRILLTLWDSKAALGTQLGGGWFAVNADGTDGRELRPTMLNAQRGAITNLRRWIAPIRRIPGSNEDILVASNERSNDGSDVYRMSTRTGRLTLLSEDNPGKVSRWVVDHDLVPRAAVSDDGKAMRRTIWFRDGAKSPWRSLGSFGYFEPGFQPLEFTRDGTLYVMSNLESGDKNGIYKLDPATGRPGEKVLAHPLVDVESVRVSPEGELIGFTFEGDKPEAIWVNPKYASLQNVMNRSLGEGVQIINVLEDGRALVMQANDRDPGTYYFFDSKLRVLKELIRPMDWIKPEQMGSTRVIRYKARDGLPMQGYLTVPAGKEAKNLPLVVWVHGGPWARDDWGWEPDVQFMASRGYAVFHPNYLGSEGFWLKQHTAGFKQLGQ